MNRARTFWRSTIGKKIVMAATGLIMVGFLIGHVSGNLLVFRGPDALNHYSAFLKGLGRSSRALRA
jgi:succinate dehydrogenase / fumarate reductase, cytochrome b subunit